MSSANMFIDHLKLTFAAKKRLPSHVFAEIALRGAREGRGIFLSIW
jgi:hypothetical protein